MTASNHLHLKPLWCSGWNDSGIGMGRVIYICNIKTHKTFKKKKKSKNTKYSESIIILVHFKY